MIKRRIGFIVRGREETQTLWQIRIKDTKARIIERYQLEAVCRLRNRNENPDDFIEYLEDSGRCYFYLVLL